MKSGISREISPTDSNRHWWRLGPRFGGTRSAHQRRNFFLPSPKCEIWGDGGGTHCIREFQYLLHGFCVYIVDFVDFNI